MPLNKSGLNIGQTTISRIVFLACSNPAMSSLFGVVSDMSCSLNVSFFIQKIE